MKVTPLTNPLPSPLTKDDLKMAELRAAGESLEKIGKATGVPLTTTARRLGRPEMRAVVEAIQAELIAETVPQAADNIRHAVMSYKEKDSDAQLRDHGYKASQRVLEAVGVLASHTPSVLVQQIYNAADAETSQDLHDISAFLRARYEDVIDVDK